MICMQMLPTYGKAVKYLSVFKKFFTISSVVESEEGIIDTIILSNNTYLPLAEVEDVKSKYPRSKYDQSMKLVHSLPPMSVPLAQMTCASLPSKRKASDHQTNLH